MSIKVGKPVSEIPVGTTSRDKGKYAPIYKQVDALANGDWLPVSFSTQREGYNFYLTAKTHRTRLFEVRQRGNTVYLRKLINSPTDEEKE